MNFRLTGRRRRRASILFALVIAACSKGGDATAPVTRDPGEVGPTGGTVTAQNDKVTLQVPPGAVSQDITITVSPISNPTNDLRVASGSLYEFGPDGTQFAQPVTLTLAYDPSDLPPGTDMASLRISKYLDGAWQEVDNISVDSVAHTVSGQIHSFSSYGVTADPCTPMLHTVGGTTTGRISAGSCLYPNAGGSPRYSDYYNFTMASAGAVRVMGSGMPGTVGVKEATSQGNEGTVWAYSSTGTPLQVALKAGTYQIFFSGQDTTQLGDYEIMSRLEDNVVPVCTSEFVGLIPGTSATATLGPSSCDITLAFADPPKYNGEQSKADYYLVKLPGGKSYTFTATIETAGTNIALALFSTYGGAHLAGLDTGGPDQTTKTVTYTPSGASEWITVEVSASTITDAWNAPLGSYTLSVSDGS